MAETATTGTKASAADQVKELGGKVVDAAKQAGVRSLDGYEKSLDRGFGFQKKIVGAVHVEPLDKLVEAQERLVTGVSGAATNVVRSVLQ